MSLQALHYRPYASPFGELALAIEPKGQLVRIAFISEQAPLQALAGLHPGRALIHDEQRSSLVARQLDEYFAGQRQTFDLELTPEGTPFQQLVWQRLQQIPAGTTTTYGEMASQLGRPKAARAVGRANATNPIPIVIPCHRLIGKNGSLTGFAGGIEFKRRLLRLESVANLASQSR